MIYLASPFSSPSSDVRRERFEAVQRATLILIQRGCVVFSPITYSHQFAAEIGTAFEPWQTFDLAMIDAASELWVLMLAGWRESIGVQAELRHARRLGLPVVFLNPMTLEPVDTLAIR